MQSPIITGILQTLIMGFIALPFSVSATVFNPQVDVDFNLTKDSTFNYNSFTINEGISVNYFVPENSFIKIISEGDITINGAIYVPINTQLILNSKKGSLSIYGSIFANNAVLIGAEKKIDYKNGNFRRQHEVKLESGLSLFAPALISIQEIPEPTSYIYTGYSSNSSGTVNAPSIIPLPISTLSY